jgi:S1-C subfamily serine protease
MNPTIEALIKAGYPVRRVNVGLAQNAPLVTKFGVTAWPCFIMVANGREVDRVVGRTSISRLQEMYEEGAAATRAAGPPALSMNSAPPAQPAFTGPPAVELPSSPSSSPPPSFDPWTPATAQQPPSAQPLKPPAAAISDAALLAASVRLRVEDPDGRSCGSGTIIDSRRDEALILTCGHLFRDSKGKGAITVDLFGAAEPTKVAGRLISYDLERDVALVAIRTPRPVAVARVAPPDYKLSAGMAVASVGCNDGDPPTVQHSQVNSLNRFQGGPNLTVAGQPVEGRSGGGLFSSEGYVIGVCNARDPDEQQGLFAAPAAIYAELDRDNLAFVYKSPNGSLDRNSPGASPMNLLVPGPMPAAAAGPADLASSTPPPPPAAVIPATAIEPIDNLPLPAREQAALDEIHRREREGAKVIIVVCPNGRNDGKGDVIVVEHASQGFVKQINAEGRSQDRHYEKTSLELPKPRRVVLEWSLPPGAPVPNPTSSTP